MKLALGHKAVSVVLLLAPVSAALIAAAVAQAVEPGPTITLTAIDAEATQAGHEIVKIAPARDSLAEANETVVITLVPKPGAYTSGDGKSASANIADSAGATRNGSGTPN